MPLLTPLLAPLLCACVYTVAALLLKRAAQHGLGSWRITFVSNWAMGLLFLPLLALPSHPWPETGWQQPALAGLAFFIGQVATFTAINGGDISVATPVLGTKALVVTLLSALLVASPIPWNWWTGALLTTAALGLLGISPAGGHRRVIHTAFFSLIAATAFAIADLVVQKFAPAWGAGHFIPVMFSTVALLSLALIPLMHESLAKISRDAWPWLGAGSILMAAQALGMALTLALFGHAPAVNIVYSSRGLWSVLLVFFAGHWFGNEEHFAGPRILRLRLLGASILSIAILLVFL